MSGFITPEARISYPNLFTPSAAVEGAEERYSAQLVFEAGTDLSGLKQMVFDALKEKFGAEEINGNAKIEVVQTDHGPANYLVTAGGLRIRLPWRDAPEDVEKKGYPEGSTFVNVKSKNPVSVVSQIPDDSNDRKPAQITNLNGDIRLRDGTVIPGAAPIYPGRYVRASINPYVYTQPANGVSLWFASGLQVMLREAERLDNRQKAEDVFDADQDAVGDLSDLAGDQPAAAPAEEEDDLSDLMGS